MISEMGFEMFYLGICNHIQLDAFTWACNFLLWLLCRNCTAW